MTDHATIYAWCFDHGRMHTFDDQPWCTATWVRLAGDTVEEATADKVARFGNAVFMHDMRLEAQGDILRIANQVGSRS
jgi:hypothetical protein